MNGKRAYANPEEIVTNDKLNACFYITPIWKHPDIYFEINLCTFSQIQQNSLILRCIFPTSPWAIYEKKNLPDLIDENNIFQIIDIRYTL